MESNRRKNIFPNLADNATLLGAIINSAPEGIVVADDKGDIILANKIADELHAHPVLGQNAPLDLADYRVLNASGEPYSPDDLPLTRAALRGEKHAAVELALIWPDDTRRDLLMNTAPIRDKDGAILGAVGIFQDITRSKRTADDVRESRQQVIDILNSISDAFFALDNSWRLTYINRKAEVLLQRRKEDLLFRNIWDVFPEAVDSAFNSELEKAKRDDVPVEFKEFYAPLNAWFLVHAYPYKNGLSVYFSDITALRETERLLLEHQQLLQGIIENTSSLIFVKDTQGRFILVNRRFEQVFGRDRSEFLGKTDYDLFEAATAEQLSAHDRRVFETGQLMEFEETATHRDGVRTYTTIKYPLRDAGGDIYALCGIATDITHRKRDEEALRQSEERFRATFELAAVGIAHVDLAGRFIRVNRAYSETVGYSKEELTKLSFEDITHPDDLEDDLKHKSALLAGEINTYSMDKRYMRKNGSIVWTTLIASIVRRDDGEPLYYITVVEDISERKRTEELADTLKEISTTMSSTLNFGDIAQRVVNDAAQALGADAAAVAMRDDAGWTIRYAYGLPSDIIGRHFTDDESPIAVLAARTRTHVAVEDAYNDPRANPELMKAYGVRSTLQIPLLAKGEVVANIGFNYLSAVHSFTRAEIDFAARLGTALSLALESARLFDAERETTRMLQVTMENTNAHLAYLDADFNFIMVNSTYERGSGHTRDELIGRNHFEFFPNEENERIFSRVRDTGEVMEFKAKPFEFVDQPWRGMTYWDWTLTPIKDEADKVSGLVLSLVDVTAAIRARQLSDALNTINTRINSTLNVNEIMEAVIVHATHAIGAESASIGLLEDGQWHVKYAYGLQTERFKGLRFPFEASPHAVRVVQTREIFVVDDVDTAAGIERESLKAFGIRSLILLPLIVKDDVLGVLIFNYHSEAIAFSDIQIDFANKLAASISLALENSRLYESERHIADTLQTALLAMPQHIEGVDMGYLYHSASEAAKVGGDFYDIFELEHGRIGIVIGDVSGKGIEASAITSVMRNVIRAHAFEGGSPARVLAKTNETVIKTSIGSNFVTVFFAVLDTLTNELSYGSAGHPPALIRKRSGEIERLAETSLVIGAFRGLEYAVGRTTLHPGETLVAYTDGIIEARNNGDFYGEERLTAFLRETAPAASADIPQAIFDSVIAFTGGGLSDDVAVLVVSPRST